MDDGKIDILYLITSFNYGGAERALLQIASQLNPHRYRFSVAALHEGSGCLIPLLREENIDYTVLGFRPKWNPAAFRRLLIFLKTKKPDILWCSLFHAVILGRLAGKLAGIPVIINWEHNENFYGSFRILLNRLTAPLSSIIVADSEKVAASAASTLGLSREKMKCIPIAGIDLKQYAAGRRSNQSHPFTIGSVGRLVPQKGYVDLIRAAAIVRKTHPEVRVMIAGDGPEESSLKTLIRQLDLNETVFLVGYTADVPGFLASVDLYVQPSWWEGLCITVIEAMAAALPLVATRTGGIPESVSAENGILVSPRSPEQLASAICQIIDHPGVRVQMGSASRRIVEEKYTLKHLKDNLDDLLSSAAVSCAARQSLDQKQ